jgi:hypothetical protein
MRFFGPPHTPESVADRLISGLENGTLVLGWESEDLVAEELLKETQRIARQIVALIESAKSEQAAADILRAVMEKVHSTSERGKLGVDRLLHTSTV